MLKKSGKNKSAGNSSFLALFDVPGRIRTAGSLLRRQILYPTEVRRLNEIIGKCTVITRLDALCVSTGSEYVMQQHKGSTNHPENHMIDLSMYKVYHKKADSSSIYAKLRLVAVKKRNKMERFLLLLLTHGMECVTMKAEQHERRMNDAIIQRK